MQGLFSPPPPPPPPPQAQALAAAHFQAGTTPTAQDFVASGVSQAEGSAAQWAELRARGGVLLRGLVEAGITPLPEHFAAAGYPEGVYEACLQDALGGSEDSEEVAPAAAATLQALPQQPQQHSHSSDTVWAEELASGLLVRTVERDLHIPGVGSGHGAVAGATGMSPLTPFFLSEGREGVPPALAMQHLLERQGQHH